MRRIETTNVTRIKCAIDLLSNCSFKELVSAMEHFEEQDGPAFEEFDRVIEYNSIIFAVMRERAFSLGVWDGKVTYTQDGVTFEWDTVNDVSVVKMDGKIITLDGAILEDDEDFGNEFLDV